MGGAIEDFLKAPIFGMGFYYLKDLDAGFVGLGNSQNVSQYYLVDAGRVRNSGAGCLSLPQDADRNFTVQKHNARTRISGINRRHIAVCKPVRQSHVLPFPYAFICRISEPDEDF